MINIQLIKLFIIINIFCFLNGNALAFYKPKIVVTEFDNPKNWNKSYSPGKIFTHLLEKELIKKAHFQIIPRGQIGEISQPKFSDPEVTHRPLPKLSKSKKMNEKLKKMRDIENQNFINMFLDEPEYRSAKNSQFLEKNYKNSYRNNYQALTFPKDKRVPKNQKFMEIEPAIHYYEDNPTFNVITIQNSNNGIINKGEDTAGESMDISINSTPWPANMGKISEKASLYKIVGQIVKFQPSTPYPSINNSEKKDDPDFENANLEVKIKLIKNNTGRVVKEQVLRAFSKSGKRPFSENIVFSSNEELNQKPSSMDLALSFVIREMVKLIKDTISASSLEGEIISVKNEDVLINIGRQNGIKVGDSFRVFSLGLNLSDPLTNIDLGDIYVKMGVIRVVETMLGFSKAIIISGEELFPGNLVKSFKNIQNSYDEFNSDFTKDDFKEEISWWEFKRN